MLVSDHFNVYLRDDFTPVVELQDYEIEYSYLSGGERTAVALAYRLALNQVINSIMSNIKTRNLVILDEPTDGFSEQQLDKMREVLDQLKVEQLIIVSHEQKIEGFVENVIRLKKENGISEKKELIFQKP
jgi:exonuclease SbcC